MSAPGRRYTLQSMLGFFVRLFITAVGLLVIARVSNDAIRVSSFGTALLVSVLVGLANATVKPVLLGIAKTMTCALTCLTLGLWSLALSFLVNGLVFWLAAQLFAGFSIHNNSFWTACLGAFALACINSLATVFTRKDGETR